MNEESDKTSFLSLKYAGKSFFLKVYLSAEINFNLKKGKLTWYKSTEVDEPV